MNKQIEIPAGKKFWDDVHEEMLYSKGCTVLLEHSLFTISEWEQKYHKRFLDPEVKKTEEELTDYIRLMVRNPEEVSLPDFLVLIREHQREISDYINDSHTATVLPKNNSGGDKEPISAELIYYWMFSSQIPLECEHWHLNKLMTLIGVFGVKNAPEKKESQRDIMERNRQQHLKRKEEREKRRRQEKEGGESK